MRLNLALHSPCVIHGGGDGHKKKKKNVKRILIAGSSHIY